MAAKQETAIRREQILRAALRLVEKKGLRQLRIPDVAGEVGLVPSAFYRHFSGKGELVLALVQRIREMVERNFQASSRETTDPLACLESVMERHMEMLLNAPGIPMVVLSEEAAFGDTGMRDQVRAVHSFFRSSVTELLGEAVAAGRLHPGTDTEAGALAFVSLLQHAAILNSMGDNISNIAALVHTAWSTYIRGLET